MLIRIRTCGAELTIRTALSKVAAQLTGIPCRCGSIEDCLFNFLLLSRDEQPLDAEASDSHIAANLLRLMKGEGGNNTVLLVRGDHGIQQGPLTADYSIQVPPPPLSLLCLT